MHRTLHFRLSFARTPFALAFVLLASSPALAQSTEAGEPVEDSASAPPEPEPEPEPEKAVETEANAPETLRSIVRGFYVEARIGGGSAVTSGEIPEDEAFPALEGESEELGAGAQIGFHLGYDINELLAVELVSGAAFVSGQRSDRVRDFALFYGGPGIRLGFEIDRRLNFTAAGAATFVRADNGVDAPDSGPGMLLGAGLEYFVHVRHFSVGIDLSVLAPFSPSRVFVGLSPRIKYSF